MKTFKLLLVDALIDNLLILLETGNFEPFTSCFLDLLEHLIRTRRALLAQ